MKRFCRLFAHKILSSSKIFFTHKVYMYSLILNLWAIIALPVTNSTELGWRDHFLNSSKYCLLSLSLISIFSLSTNPLTQLVCTLLNIYSSCKSPNWHLHAQSNVLFLVLILLAFSVLFNVLSLYLWKTFFAKLSRVQIFCLFLFYQLLLCHFLFTFCSLIPLLGGRSYDLSTHTHSHGKFIWSQINMRICP